MSLLIRMAQTRSGAERLLEARLFSILSQCDYLDTRPEADHAFIGKVYLRVHDIIFTLCRSRFLFALCHSTISSTFHACDAITECGRLKPWT
jgi:hypothetical protein